MIYQCLDEFNELKAIVEELQPKRIMEIGSLHGETLRHWIRIASQAVLSLDMLVPQSDDRFKVQVTGHNETWYDWANESGVKLGIMDTDSTAPGTVDRVYDYWAQFLPDKEAVGRDILGSIDFLFIDGGHDFQTAALDYANYSPLVRPGGVVAFHDRSNPDWPEVEIFWRAIKRGFKHKEIGGRMGIGVLWK